MALGGGHSLCKGLAVGPSDAHLRTPRLMPGPGDEREGHSSDRIPPHSQIFQSKGGGRGVRRGRRSPMPPWESRGVTHMEAGAAG